jgi:protoporphyrinogen oxidase
MMETVILGGGLSGLATAYELSKHGIKVRVIEKDSQPGGLARVFKLGKTWLDVYYHHIFTSNKTFIRLSKELGIEDKLIWENPKMGVYYKGKTYGMGALDILLDFKPLKIPDKFGFGWLTFRVLMKNKWEDLDSIKARDWMIKHGGKRTFDILFKPLLKAKWGKYGNQVSAAWFWGRLKPRAQSRGFAFLSEKLGYMEGSFKTFIDALVSAIKDNGGVIETDSEVKKIVTKDGFVVGVEYKKNGKTIKVNCERVVSTLPLPIFLKVATGLGKSYRERLGKIEYEGVICTVLSLKKSLGDIYWLNVCSNSPFGGVIEHTNFIDKSVYNGENIVYLLDYLGTKGKKWKMSEEKLLEEYKKGLKKIFPDFSEEDINWVKVYRDVYATPIYKINYGKHMPAITTPVNGLYFAGVFKTYPLNRNMDTALISGLETAREIINS